MGLARDEFEAELYRIWAEYLGYPMFLMTSGGSGVIGVEKLDGTGNVYLYRLGERSMAQCDPDVQDILVDTMQKIVERNGPEYGMTVVDIRAELRDVQIELDHAVRIEVGAPHAFDAPRTGDVEHDLTLQYVVVYQTPDNKVGDMVVEVERMRTEVSDLP